MTGTVMPLAGYPPATFVPTSLAMASMRVRSSAIFSGIDSARFTRS